MKGDVVMTTLEAIELFRHEMTNEIFHAHLNDEQQDSLLHSLDDVSRTVIQTYEADKTNR